MRKPNIIPQIRSTSSNANRFHCAPQPNWAFNANVNMGHAFGIVMAHVGALRAPRSGAR